MNVNVNIRHNDGVWRSILNNYRMMKANSNLMNATGYLLIQKYLIEKKNFEWKSLPKLTNTIDFSFFFVVLKEIKMCYSHVEH